jgi:hypothetical protein
VEFLKAAGLDDFAMWVIIVLASIVGTVAAAFILSVVARWIYSRHPGEICVLILAVILVTAGTYAITPFGIWPVMKWLLLALAALTSSRSAVCMVNSQMPLVLPYRYEKHWSSVAT